MYLYTYTINMHLYIYMCVCMSQLHVSSHHVYVNEICQNVDHLSSQQSTPPAVQRARRPPFSSTKSVEKTWPWPCHSHG